MLLAVVRDIGIVSVPEPLTPAAEIVEENHDQQAFPPRYQ